MRALVYCLCTLALITLGACRMDRGADPSGAILAAAASDARAADRHRDNGKGAHSVPLENVTAYCVAVRDTRTKNPAFASGDWCDAFDPREEFATVANIG